jgi:hypothetical protein
LTSAHRRTGQRAYNSAKGRTRHGAVDGRVVGCRAADLAKRELPAIGIVAAELIETFACPRHRHDARPVRYGHARGDAQQRDKG